MKNAKMQRKIIKCERLEIKKVGDIKRTFHARMGTIKDRNNKDLIKAKEIEKRRQEHT